MCLKYNSNFKYKLHPIKYCNGTGLQFKHQALTSVWFPCRALIRGWLQKHLNTCHCHNTKVLYCIDWQGGKLQTELQLWRQYFETLNTQRGDPASEAISDNVVHSAKCLSVCQPWWWQSRDSLRLKIADCASHISVVWIFWLRIWS